MNNTASSVPHRKPGRGLAAVLGACCALALGAQEWPGFKVGMGIGG